MTTSMRVCLGLLLAATGTLCACGSGEAPAADAAPAASSRTELAAGTVANPVPLVATAPGEVHVFTATLAPADATGWHRHPGPEVTVLEAGTVTLVRAPECRPEVLSAGQAVVIPAGVVHLARNDGPEPAEIYPTYVLPRGSAVQEAVSTTPCPGL